MKLIHQEQSLRLWQGDARCLDAIADNSVHLVATSPPYFSARPEYATWSTYRQYLADLLEALEESYRVLCASGRIAVNVPMGYGRPGNEHGYLPIGADFIAMLEEAGFTLRGVIVWDKGRHVLGTAWGSWLSPSNPSLRDQYELIIVAHKGAARRDGGESTIDPQTFTDATSSVWSIPAARHDWHPAPWPAEIPRRLIELYTFQGDTVLDPFSGSGTTAFCAQRLGRLGLGVDLSEEYVRRSAGPMFCAEGPV